MYKNHAVKLYDEYAQRDDSKDLSFRQIDAVVAELLKTRFDHEATVDDVAKIVDRMFPEEETSMPQNPTQQKQSISEVSQIIEYFVAHYWSTYTRAIPPTENGQKKSNINYMAFGTAVRNRFNEGKRIGHDVLGEIVLSLDQQKLLEHPPAVVERVVEKEVHVPLTRREEAKQNFKLDKKMNSSDSPIKGRGEQEAKKPVATEEQLVAQARHDLQENSTMGDVRSVIAGHSHSGSHAATKYEREILTNIMTTGIRNGVSAEKLLVDVKAKQNSMAKWGPQQALKELRPELFAGQPKAQGY